MRNMTMLIKFKPDAVIAFPGGTGTDDMVKQARQHKVRIIFLA